MNMIHDLVEEHLDAILDRDTLESQLDFYLKAILDSDDVEELCYLLEREEELNRVDSCPSRFKELPV